jgi:hypothetical protein
MIKTETVTINETEFLRTYSDEYFYIERDGVLYEEAVDPLNSGRVYTETAEVIECAEATEEDYQAELERLGVEFNEEA